MNQLISYQRHYKELIYLGVPIMIGQLGTIILGFADTMMIGHHSAAELSAAGFVNTIFNLAIIFGLGFSYGLTPIIGALYGRGEEQDAGGKLKKQPHSQSIHCYVSVLSHGHPLSQSGPFGTTRRAIALHQALLSYLMDIIATYHDVQRLQAICRRHH